MLSVQCSKKSKVKKHKSKKLKKFSKNITKLEMKLKRKNKLINSHPLPLKKNKKERKKEITSFLTSFNFVSLKWHNNLKASHCRALLRCYFVVLFTLNK